jgi:dTDP-L-rhamnose 4-epimerase
VTFGGSCLVTGGAGFIGCALSAALAVRFERVIALDVLHPQVHGSRKRPSALTAMVELWPLDVADPATWDRVLEEVTPSVIIHLAAETGTGQSLTEATRHAQTNVTGTAMMLDALSARGAVPERIILSSSRAVYGNGAWQSSNAEGVVYPKHRTREQLMRGEWDFPGLHYLPAEASITRLLPISIYGATKLAQEHLLTAWAAAYGTLPIVLRLQNVYGPGQSLSNPYTGIIPLFCRYAKRGDSIPLFEDGQMLRDFILIDDVVSAILSALGVAQTGEHTYDVGTGVATTIAALADRIAELYGAPPPRVCGRYRYGDVRHAACEIEATRRALAWSPRHVLSNGLARLKDWVDMELAHEEH